MASSPFSSPFSFLNLTPPSLSKPKTQTRVRPSPTHYSSLSDPFVLQLAERLEDSLPSSPSPPLQNLRNTSSQSLLSKPWPSRKQEPFRFTNFSFLKNSQIHPISIPPTTPFPNISDTQFPNLLIVDGHIAFSQLSGLPEGVFVGSISEAPETLVKRVLDSVSQFSDGDLFWDLNGIGAPDVTVVFVPAGCRIEMPLHLRFLSRESSDDASIRIPVSNPRLMVLVEKGGEIGIIEEYLGCDEGKCYWANSVMEILIEEGGKVHHSYIQRQDENAAHIKWTHARQGSSSTYELVETSTGGKLSRHNLHIQQLGPDTVTDISAFHFSGSSQTQDLHSRLVLDHPRGYSRQLHKCIVSHSSGKAVFDGNIKVNRYAQQTDAGQLTRTLLMAPSATVNLKPNLQIIADDVKCSHGAAISDLEEDQLFYFQARGIDLQTARNALVFSFGAEVMERLPYAPLRKRVENYVKGLLADKGVLLQ
ncbi:non-intrinsic ABC protein 6 [Tasmannia lanceolata]|uniref:non-intrinsic ABC protein 6 n=1 Tax=Tasmannia lanceolata TaxID=3420 RepID=UPI004063273F